MTTSDRLAKQARLLLRTATLRKRTEELGNAAHPLAHAAHDELKALLARHKSALEAFARERESGGD